MSTTIFEDRDRGLMIVRAANGSSNGGGVRFEISIRHQAIALSAVEVQLLLHTLQGKTMREAVSSALTREVPL